LLRRSRCKQSRAASSTGLSQCPPVLLLYLLGVSDEYKNTRYSSQVPTSSVRCLMSSPNISTARMVWSSQYAFALITDYRWQLIYKACCSISHQRDSRSANVKFKPHTYLVFITCTRTHIPKEVSRHQHPQLTVEADLTNLVRIGRLSCHRLSDRYQTRHTSINGIIHICIKYISTCVASSIPN
jgi:hypothetical protein